MHNLTALLTLRRRGVTPALVNIDTEAGRLRFPAGFTGASATCVETRIEPHEALHRLDLRCIADLTVAVDGCDGERVQAVCEACVKAGAARVIGTTHSRERDFRAVRVTDTEDVFSWQE